VNPAPRRAMSWWEALAPAFNDAVSSSSVYRITVHGAELCSSLQALARLFHRDQVLPPRTLRKPQRGTESKAGVRCGDARWSTEGCGAS
jgi:hypothetical protein